MVGRGDRRLQVGVAALMTSPRRLDNIPTVVFREKLFSHLKVEVVCELQRKWGNIPRYVLEKVRWVLLLGLVSYSIAVGI
jgi:hypothetical protein